MKITKLALFFYIVFAVASTIANFMDWNGLKLFAKPLVIPALSFYYLANVKRVDLLPGLFLFFCFIGDAVALMDFEGEILYLMGPFFCANIIICVMAWMDLEPWKSDWSNVFSIFVVLSFLFYLWKAVVSFFETTTSNMQLYVGVFGLTLVIMNAITAYNCIWRMQMSNLFLLLTAVSILISQVFYVIYNFEFRLIVLDTIHFICQNLSYLFLVLYVLNTSAKKEITEA